MNVRYFQTVHVLDLIRRGVSLGDALRETLHSVTHDGSFPPTSCVADEVLEILKRESSAK